MKTICILNSHSQLLQAKRKHEISIFVTFLAKKCNFGLSFAVEVEIYDEVFTTQKILYITIL